jgi:hypothetical protein
MLFPFWYMLQNGGVRKAMLVDVELRDPLSLYCMVTHQTQERAANEAIRELLKRAEGDPAMRERMERAKELRQLLKTL